MPTAAVVYDMNGGAWVYEATGGDHLRAPAHRDSIADRRQDSVAAASTPGKKVVTAGAAELFGTEFGAGK